MEWKGLEEHHKRRGAASLRKLCAALAERTAPLPALAALLISNTSTLIALVGRPAGDAAADQNGLAAALRALPSGLHVLYGL